MAREILFDLGKMITDRIPYKLGLKRLTETDPEYIILDRACSSDEIAEVMLKMGLRKPKTTAEIAKLTGKSEERVVELLTDAAEKGMVCPALRPRHRRDDQHGPLAGREVSRAGRRLR